MVEEMMEPYNVKLHLNVPALRFPEFEGEWSIKTISDLLDRVGEAVIPLQEKEYREIGIRSHGKGLFHKNYVTGESLGNKRVFQVVPDSLVLNIVFAWEQAIAITTEEEKGFIASHRFPMFQPNGDEASLEFLLKFFLRPKGKFLLELASPGGAGRNKTLGQKDFLKTKLSVPRIEEQQKIATFLTTVDQKIEKLQQKKDLLTDYKKGIIQKLFSQELRFKDDQGNDFPDWYEKKLGDIARFKKGKGVSKGEIVENGMTPCIRYGQLYTHYAEVISTIISFTDTPVEELVMSEANEVIIPASGESALDIATASCVMLSGVALGGDLNIISTQENGIYLAYYLNGAKKVAIARLSQGVSVIHLYPSHLAALNIQVPHSAEQQKIAESLMSLDKKIELTTQKLTQAQAFKKGLLQQMFI